MQLEMLDDLLIDRLTSAYHGEYQLSVALSALTRVSSSPDLHETLDDLRQLCTDHLGSIDSVLSTMHVSKGPGENTAVAALVHDEEHIRKRVADPILRDAAMIASVREVLHYQRAVYENARDFARELGFGDVLSTLQHVINDEDRIDKRLLDLAQGGILRSGLYQRTPRNQTTTP